MRPGDPPNGFHTPKTPSRRSEGPDAGSNLAPIGNLDNPAGAGATECLPGIFAHPGWTVGSARLVGYRLADSVELGRFPIASRGWRRVSKARFNLGDALLNAGDRDEAVADFEQVLALLEIGEERWSACHLNDGGVG